MITIEGLKALGADTDSGLERCMNNEAFYLRLVEVALNDDKYGVLKEEAAAHDLKKGFETAHALKGMLSNLGLTNVLEPVIAITEGMRHEEDLDYLALVDQMDQELEKLNALRD